MSIGLKKGGIGRWKPGHLMVKEVTAAGVDLTVPDTFKKLGYIKSAKLSDAFNVEEVKDERGLIVRVIESDRVVKVTGNFMQTDKDLIDFLTSSCRDKFYAIYKDNGIVNGFNQEIVFGICQFKPGADLEGQVPNPAFELICLCNDEILSITMPTGAHATGPVSIPIEAHYIISETAVA